MTGTPHACPKCGFVEWLTTSEPPAYAWRCEECGAEMKPTPLPVDSIQFHGTKYLEEGAEAIRELVDG